MCVYPMVYLVINKNNVSIYTYTLCGANIKAFNNIHRKLDLKTFSSNAHHPHMPGPSAVSKGCFWCPDNRQPSLFRAKMKRFSKKQEKQAAVKKEVKTLDTGKLFKASRDKLKKGGVLTYCTDADQGCRRGAFGARDWHTHGIFLAPQGVPSTYVLLPLRLLVMLRLLVIPSCSCS